MEPKHATRGATAVVELAKPGLEWREAFVIDEERKKAKTLLRAATNPREQLRLLGSASSFEKKLQEACVALMEEVAKGFGLRAKQGRVLECLDLPKAHDIAADPAARDRGEPNPLPGIIVRDQSSRLLGYIVYCLDSTLAVEVLRQRLEKDNCFHNVLVIFPGLAGPQFELWQGPDRLDGLLVKRGARLAPEAALVSLLTRFFVVGRNRLSDPTELASELAKRARFLRRLAERQLHEEKAETEAEKKQLTVLYDAFKAGLIHAMTPGEFADAYAQTMTYGLLSARWISKDELSEEARKTRKASEPVPQFTRAYAQAHLNSTSPFLQALFERVLSEKFEPKLAWLLDDIAALLNQVTVGDVFDPKKVKSDVSNDPVIHFYEPFLAAYDKEMKKARGVYYTPQPVVSFIVRSVDEVLRNEFGLAGGLASTETWGEVRARFPAIVVPEGATEATPFVCILDPATGTGTFLVTVVDTIFATLRARWEREGKSVAAEWQAWVPKYLLPRLNAFELMVAAYAVAHLKIGLKLRELGYVPGPGERANIYLTNALSDGVGTTDLFPGFVVGESAEARSIKQSSLVTVLLGNPPYSLVSGNMAASERESVQRYKYVHGERLKERGALQLEKILNDDYVKFLCLAENFALRTPLFVFGMVTNHAYIDNPTMRGLRASLLDSYGKLRITDLHGSLKKRVAAEDENVFDIQQGVAIAVGTRRPGGPRSVEHFSVVGDRQFKYSWLSSTYGEAVPWTLVEARPPFYLLRPMGGQSQSDYDEFVGLAEMFPHHSIGFFTSKDGLVIDRDRQALAARIARFRDSSLSDDRLCTEFDIVAKKAWNVGKSRDALRAILRPDERVYEFLHRPFDRKFVFYDRSLVWSLSLPVNQHMIGGSNVAIAVSRQLASPGWAHVWCTDTLVELSYVSNRTKEGNHVFPMLLGQGDGWVPNLEPAVLESFQAVSAGPVSASDVMAWAYAVLHSPTYRLLYAEKLQMDFPRIPIPPSGDSLIELVRLGARLVDIHLMRNGALDRLELPEVRGRAGTVERPAWTDSYVVLGEGCSIGPVPEVVWNFQIGSYKVCEKWLKDRKGRTLTAEDILHYRRIIAALGETIRIMAEIDVVIEKHGGWPGAFAEKP